MAKKVDVATIVARPYARIVRQEEGGFTAEVLEFPNCWAGGDSYQEVWDNLQETMQAWVESELDQGRAIPEPIEEREYSGRLSLRIPSSLHQQLAHRAELNRTSLNRTIVDAIAAYLGDLRAGGGEEGIRRIADRGGSGYRTDGPRRKR